MRTIFINEINPYAPPEPSAETAPGDHPWYTEGDKIHVRHGAILPPIELETGEQGEHLVPVLRRYDQMRLEHSASLLIVVIALVFLPRFKSFWVLPAIAFALSYPVQWLTKRLLPHRPPLQVRFKVFRNIRTERREKRNRIMSLISLVVWIWLIAGLAWLIRDVDGESGLGIGIVGVPGLATIGFWIYKSRPIIQRTPGPDDSVKLSGSNPSALMKLKEIEARRNHAKIEEKP